MSTASVILQTLSELGITSGVAHSGANLGTNEWIKTKGPELVSRCPTTGEVLGTVAQGTREDYETIAATADRTFATWRMVPAPRRGEVVRQLGEVRN